MKFTYQYRTPDNVSHEGVISASTRDEAFAKLKRDGIRPGRVEECPGFFNALFGKGKRWLAIGVLSVAVVVLGAVLFVVRTEEPVRGPQVEERSQIYGDPSILQRCTASRWRNVFKDMGDVLLAQFAQPGIRVEGFDARTRQSFAASLEMSNPGTIVFAEDDFPEIAKMKRIVLGMKREYAEYVAAGGKALGYVDRLIERQNVEATIVEETNRAFELLYARGSKARDLTRYIKSWNEKNELLRRMGLQSVPLPEGWER